MIHERDGRTDRQTPHHSIYRAYVYASRGKNGSCHFTASRRNTFVEGTCALPSALPVYVVFFKLFLSTTCW